MKEYTLYKIINKADKMKSIIQGIWFPRTMVFRNPLKCLLLLFVFFTLIHELHAQTEFPIRRFLVFGHGRGND